MRCGEKLSDARKLAIRFLVDLMSTANAAFGTGWETSRAAGALLAAIAVDDEAVVARAASRARLNASEGSGCDGWTEERAELLGALAAQAEAGVMNTAGLRLLRHLSAYPAAGFSGRMM
jgi:hypothetical protein